MKLLVQSKLFCKSIANGEDRAKFERYFSGRRNFQSMPLLQVTLPEAKTLSQLGAIWLDFTKVGKLLFCEPSYVYYLCLRADCLQDIWLAEKDGQYIFNTLSGLSKEKTIEAIPRFRDFLQQLVKEKYGEWVVINWSCQENIGKPDYEFFEK